LKTINLMGGGRDYHQLFPVLQGLAEQLWQHSGMPAPLIRHLRASLLHNAVDNMVKLGPK